MKRSRKYKMVNEIAAATIAIGIVAVGLFANVGVVYALVLQPMLLAATLLSALLVDYRLSSPPACCTILNLPVTPMRCAQPPENRDDIAA